ncbi:relaxase/mobilization nuclease domain-containing protein [Rhizobium leguminosarum]|uniref:relaxase/mobilization nuclease domain-containing protein n=1 Tax=Rhizobium leguminosarum TaxID=384 RepID=UPI001C984EA6|nr:hypothetical protein [Rhizobium leguminosarum]MBY5736407.1 hypothetical protein [Rhizobium leguminosarum]
MIIKAIRFRTTSSVKRLISHLQNGDDNDNVEFLSGTATDIADMHQDALTKRSTYSIRHWIIAPHEATSRRQMREVLEMIAGEFGFDPARAVIIEHQKPRAASDAHSTHWHVLVGEIDPASGKVLRCSFDRIIHELVARWSEYKFGHRFIPGTHTKAVVAGLRKRGAIDVAQSVDAQLGGAEPCSREAFTNAQHQAAKRVGNDVAAIRQVVKHAFANVSNRAELEAAMAASELQIMTGEKPCTWIVTDTDGRFIGSLGRLAGKKKSEIDNIMKVVDDEPTNGKPDNRTSNSRRSESHPQPASTVKQSADARSRHADSDSGENPGSTRKRVEPDRTAKPETGSPDADTSSPIGWLTRLNSYRDQLSLLMGKVNVLAMTPEERIAVSLWEIEEQARADLNRRIPDFKVSEKTTGIRGEVADLETSAGKKWDILFDAERRLAEAPRPRWWHYLLGIAFIFERQQRRCMSAVQQASEVLHSCNRDLEALKKKLVRQEFQEKQEHANLVREIAQRKQAAGLLLEQVSAASEIIRVHPAMAFCGLKFLLARASDRIDEERQKEPKTVTTLDNDGLSYKR